MKKILLISVLFLDCFLILYSKEVIREFTLTIRIFIYSLLPFMFFQILFTDILNSVELYKYMPSKICNFFNINKKELSIIILSMFSGYPNNIKLLKESDNEYLNYSTNYVNPLFILGTVGNIYLKNVKISILTLISHVISNIFLLYMLK